MVEVINGVKNIKKLNIRNGLTSNPVINKASGLQSNPVVNKKGGSIKKEKNKLQKDRKYLNEKKNIIIYNGRIKSNHSVIK